MFVLNSNITIGSYRNVQVHDVKITKSVYAYVDKAVIKVPAKSRLKTTDKGTNPIIGDTKDTASVFKEGMTVTIQLGYNNAFKEEFTGFVSRINLAAPVEIECEGYSYSLRKKTYEQTFVQKKLLDIVKTLTQGTGIIIEDNRIADVIIDKLVLEKKTGTEALEKLKEALDNSVTFHFEGNQLVAEVFPIVVKTDERQQEKKVHYTMGWNVIKDNDLKLHQAQNTKVIVRYIGEGKDGRQIIGEAGAQGEVKEYKTHQVTDAATLQKMAAAKQSRLSYDGYEGKLIAFLAPYCEPGYKAVLEDRKYPERGGNYLVLSTEVTYGTTGARRIVEIGQKL